MMRRISGAALVASLFVPLSIAHATEVMRFPANNMFASAISTVGDNTTGVFVTHAKGSRGGPVDSIFVIFSGLNGASFVGGTLPAGAFHIDAKSASLDVDISEIAVEQSSGDLPATGLISVDWNATGVTHTSGSAQFNFDNTHVIIAGTSTNAEAGVDGSVLGTAMVDDAFGFLSSSKQAVIIVTQD
jgi:hypothetical protein